MICRFGQLLPPPLLYNLMNSSYLPSWISTLLSAKIDLSLNWENLICLALVRNINLSCLSSPVEGICLCGGFTMSDLLCSSPSPTGTWVGWVRDVALVGAFFLLDMGVPYWVGGDVLFLFSGLLIGIFSGLFSFLGSGLYSILLICNLFVLWSCFCFVLASTLGLDLGSLCFRCGANAKTLGVVLVNDPSVDSTTIRASSRPFLSLCLKQQSFGFSMVSFYTSETRNIKFPIPICL